MPTPTYTLIDSEVLAAQATSVSFTSIPADYRDLVLIVDAFAGADSIGPSIRFNSDSGSNYDWVRMGGNGSSTLSTASSSQTFIPAYLYNTPDPGESGIWIINIMDYSTTDKHKSVIFRGSSVDGVDAFAGRWADTSAITAIEFYTGNTNALGVGSTFYLYGIEA